MNLYEMLARLQISYRQISHRAVYTIEEALEEDISGKIGGIECKNLLLKGRTQFYLVFLEAHQRADIKGLARMLGESRLRFATAQELGEVLRLEPGSVSPMGIINDVQKRVTLLLDGNLQGKEVLVHPNDNTRTLALAFEDLIRFLQACGHAYRYI